MLNGYTATKEEMQAYSTELFDLYSKGAFKLATYNDGYPFTAEGIKQAQEDISTLMSSGFLCAPLMICNSGSIAQNDGQALDTCTVVVRYTSGRI